MYIHVRACACVHALAYVCKYAHVHVHISINIPDLVTVFSQKVDAVDVKLGYVYVRVQQVLGTAKARSTL